MRHCAKFREDRSNRVKPFRRYDRFSIFKMAAVRHLEFLKFWSLNFRSGPVRRPNLRCHTKFREDRSNRSGDMADFRFSKWRPSAILYLFHTCWDHPRRVFGGLCDCAKFGCNRRSNFDSMQIVIFCALSLKMPVQAPKIGGFVGFYPPKWGAVWKRPQKAHPWAETRRMTYRSSKSVHVCALGASRRIK